MRRSKQFLLLRQKDPNMTRKYRAEISRQRTELAVLLCALGPGERGRGEGLGLLRCMGYQRYERPQRVRLLDCLCVKKV